MDIDSIERRRFLLGVSLAALGATLSGANVAFALAGPKERDQMVAVARIMFPHARLGNGPYERALDSFQDQTEQTQFLSRLLSAARQSFAGLTEDKRKKLLTDLADDPFLDRLSRHLKKELYEDPEVWTAIGYQGPSLKYGGYLYRGFDDIDWLPKLTEGSA